MNGNKPPGAGKKVRLIALVGMVGAALAVASCDSSTAPTVKMGQLQVKITDAPSTMLSSADIWVSRVYLQGGADSTAADSSSSVDLFNDSTSPEHFDLLTLRDSVSAALTAAKRLDVGSYSQLRIVVDSARLALASGYVFADSSSTGSLAVPSAQQSGIKVQLSRPLDVAADSTTTLVVDFNVDQNFVIQQNPDGTVRQILFTPVLQEKLRERS